MRYQPDGSGYIHLFAERHGYGMPKYHGSPMIGENFWNQGLSFAKGLFSRETPDLLHAPIKA